MKSHFDPNTLNVRQQFLKFIASVSAMFVLGFVGVACSVRDDSNGPQPASVSAVYGFLLEESQGREHMARLTNGSDADIIMFMDKDCSVCSLAIQQAEILSERHRVLVAPIELVNSKRKGVEADYEHAVWRSNWTAFERVGGKGLPLWMGSDACGRRFVIEGVLLATDLRGMATCEFESRLSPELGDRGQKIWKS